MYVVAYEGTTVVSLPLNVECCQCIVKSLDKWAVLFVEAFFYSNI